MMRAVVIGEPGGPDVLRQEEVADPVPGPDDVLIAITAAGVNRADLMQRQGFYPPPPGAPEYPGLECSGRVAAVGERVTAWRPGDKVCALLAGGGYAEQVAVPAVQVLPVPDGLEVGKAAALPEAACTVHANLFMAGRLAPGETVLVHGGASGIGTMAIQLAWARGARVMCTAGSPAKLQRCRELGAELTIDYNTEDFGAAVSEFTSGRGADVILDIIGGAYLRRNIAALAVGGRLIVVGLQGGGTGELELGTMLMRRLTVHAASLRARPVADKAVIVAGVRDHVWPLVAGGQVQAVIDTVFPLAQAAEAHRLMESGQHVGKILLAAGAG